MKIVMYLIVGTLMYLNATRHHIMQALSSVSRFVESLSKIHFGEAKRILRYVTRKKNCGIWYTSRDHFGLVGYTYSDWDGCNDNRKNNSRFVCFHPGTRCAISWSSKK